MAAHLQPDCCAVCLSTSHLGYHFGALTCAACCAFFRRYIENEKSGRYKCRRDSNKCTIREIRQCKICRFNYCLKAGMNPTQLVFSSTDADLQQLAAMGTAKNLVVVAHTFRKLRLHKMEKSELKIECGASTSDTSYSFEMHKELVWEERESAQLFISQTKLFEDLSLDDEITLQEEFIKAWLPHMFGVWTALNGGCEQKRIYTSPKTYFELDVEVLTKLLISNFWDVKPYIPFDFSLLGKQFFAIVSHHLRCICPLFRTDDTDIDLGIQTLFMLLNSGRGLSFGGRQIIQNARNQMFRELFNYYKFRQEDFAQKIGDLTSFYQIMADSVNLFNEMLSTMQMHCGPDHFLYMMPRRIHKELQEAKRNAAKNSTIKEIHASGIAEHTGDDNTS